MHIAGLTMYYHFDYEMSTWDYADGLMTALLRSLYNAQVINQ